MENNEILSENNRSIKKGPLLLRIGYLKSYILFPLFVIIFLILETVYNPSFYENLLKNAGLVQSYIELKNNQIDKEIQNYIDKDLEMKEKINSYNILQNTLNELTLKYNIVNKTKEYQDIQQKINILEELSWKNAPSTFSDKGMFKSYKKSEIAKYELELNVIEKHRHKNKSLINNLEKAIKTTEEEFKDLKKIIVENEEKIKKIIAEKKNSFSGMLYHDLEIIGNDLTDALNDKFINKQVKPEIKKMLYFFTSYNEQVKNGAITNIQGLKVVRFPRVRMSLLVDDEINGILQKRHLFSDIFIDIVNGARVNLKNYNFFIKVFDFADSSIAQFLSNRALKDVYFKISNGQIVMEPLVFKGREADRVSLYILISSFLYKFRYLFPVFILIIFILVPFTFRSKEQRRKKLGNLLYYPSFFFMIFFGILAFFPGKTLLWLPLGLDELSIDIFNSLRYTFSVYFIFPLLIFFFLSFVIGRVIKKRTIV